MTKQTILIVEDDTQLYKCICCLLKQEKYHCLTATHTKSILTILMSQPVEVIILNIDLPPFKGIEIIKKIRQWSEVPIIVLSTQTQVQVKIEALNSGADYYLIKPFFMEELIAIIRVALKRSHQMTKSFEPTLYSVGQLSLHLDKHLAFLKGQEIHLTPLEYTLLSLFFKNSGKVLTTQYILNEIYGTSYGTDTQALRSLISGLRKKIEPNAAKPHYILTEIGVGYRLISEESEAN